MEAAWAEALRLSKRCPTLRLQRCPALSQIEPQRFSRASFSACSARSRLASVASRSRRSASATVVEPMAVNARSSVTDAAKAATKGFRMHHRQSRSTPPIGRARIGSPRTKPPQIFGHVARGLRNVSPAA